ncbi:YcgR family protein [Sulfuricella denitrificans skB26]|uniref:Flagellar brake protein YcgR n=1 Tax=Sulfuricella denitrificans (strain DSM 22764 / NBRC 105220 / skB26) TaxID=1163617 RepID=S6B8T9_SULDS|nr:flagellar brake protein [Sulfuricella denitrificans]BAN36737.1 YcgR family protein [Sulfuricella denitrificans skB26]
MVTPAENSSQGLSVANEDDASSFTVSWKKEIVYILRAVMEKTELVTIYFNRGENFILTSIIDIDPDEERVFLDLGANEALNEKILDSGKIIFVTAQEKVKVQFVANWIEKTRLEGRDVFMTELPKSLIKLQRREYYRVTTPIVNPLKCIVLMDDKRKVEMAVADISIGGVGVVLPPEGAVVEPGMVFNGCNLILPEIGNIVATMEIRNVFEVTLRNGLKTKRAGCQFINLSAHTQSMIQRYIIKMERERRAMERDRQ